MRIRLYRSGQALYGVANALHWKRSKRQISTHLTVLKHQITKTSLCKLSENHWVFAFFDFFGSLKKTLQSTVFNDHPVCHIFLFSGYCNMDDNLGGQLARMCAFCIERWHSEIFPHPECFPRHTA